jgi:hypothetical protein
MRSDNESGFIGVWWSNKDKKWESQISVNGHRVWVGCFKTPEEAAKARDAAAFFYHGSFAVLNFSIKRFPRLP